MFHVICSARIELRIEFTKQTDDAHNLQALIKSFSITGFFNHFHNIRSKSTNWIKYRLESSYLELLTYHAHCHCVELELIQLMYGTRHVYRLNDEQTQKNL